MAVGKVGTQMAIGTGILLVGCLLLGYMVIVESEPGAIPLLLVAVGAVWCFLAWRTRRPRL